MNEEEEKEMKVINGFETVEVLNDAPANTVPKGGYVCVIKGVALKQGRNGEYLEMDVDIAEGEYKGFYDRLYTQNMDTNKGWRCRYFVSIPADTGTQKDSFKLRVFKTFIAHIEESNSGYHWNWNEETLKDKLIGGLFVGKEFEGTDGEVRQTISLSKVCPVQDIREGKFKLPKDQVLSHKASDGFIEVGNANGDQLQCDLPF